MSETSSIESLLGNSFSIDFSTIILARLTDPSNPIYQGPGSLSQDADGKLLVKVFLTHDVTFEDEAWEINGIIPGKILGKEHYYQMEATGYDGAVWFAERFRISKKIYNSIVGNSGTVEAKLHSVFSNDALEVSRESEKRLIIIPFRLDLPWNKMEQRGTARVLSCLEFQLKKDMDVRIFLRENYTEVELTSRAIVDEATTLNLLKGLSIGTGQLITKVHERYLKNGKAKTTIWSMPRKGADNQLPKIIPNHYSEPLIDFLQRYVDYTAIKPNSYYSYWVKIHNAWRADLTVAALPLSIFIEGVIDEFFPELRCEDKPLVKAVEIAQHKIAELDVSLEILKRIQGAIKRLGKGSVSSALRALSMQGWFRRELVVIHGKLRNRSAHAVDDSQSEDEVAIQKMVNRIFGCLTLFYLLLLIKIEYRGPYIDLSTLGYPEVELSGQHSI